LLKLRLLLLILLNCAALAACASPQMLIAKLLPASKQQDGDPGETLVQYIAQEFDEDGRVSPIAWGLTDPYFRAAVEDGLLKSASKQPDLEEALAAGNRLKVEYVLAVTVTRAEGALRATATLYRHGKALWRDPQKGGKNIDIQLHNREIAAKIAKKNKQPVSEQELLDPDVRVITISNSGADSENELRSLAHTWATMLENETLKALVSRPKPQQMQVETGQKPPPVEIPAVKRVDNQQLLADAMKLLNAHQGAQAINILRDGVDAEPLDISRRKALVMALMQTGQPLMAALEARRAAALLPSQVELRVLAARAYIAAGQMDEARADLKEAVARDPDAPETRMLLGEVSLSKMQLQEAIGHFDFVVAKSADPEALYKRALAKAMADDTAGATVDMEAAKKAGLVQDQFSISSRYEYTMTLINPALEDLGPRSRTLLQRARVRSTDEAVATDNRALQKKTGALSSFLDGLVVPAAHKASHERLLLALKLLNQSLTDIEDFVKSQSEDSISDATINIGEALKNLTSAKETYKTELQKG
jgi:tetratricopeptide (TPR) repeat protein